MTELHADEMSHPTPAAPRTNGHAPDDDFAKAFYDPNAGATFSMYRRVSDSGLAQSGGYITEEFLRELQGWPKSAKVYREMADNSDAVGAMLFAIQQTVRRIEWTAVPAEEGNTEAEDLAVFADDLREDMNQTWEEFIVEMLSMLVYGFAPMEIVLKRRDDGQIGVADLFIIGQDTVSSWDFAPDGDVRGLWQQPFVGPQIYVPAKKFLLFRPTHQKNNPEGRSILRNAYRPWLFQKQLEEMQGIAYSRMSGFPVVRVPKKLLNDAANGQVAAQQELAAWKKLVTRTRVNEQMGMVLPSDPYLDPDQKPVNVTQYAFELVVPARAPAADFDKAIASKRTAILATVLADFIDLGHDARGTQALGVSKADLFLGGCAGWLKAAAAVLNRDLLPLVWRMNGLDPDLMPQYVPEMPRQADVDAQSAAILRLAQAGMPMFPDPELENVLRTDLGLPEVPEEGVRDVTLATFQQQIDQGQAELEAARNGGTEPGRGEAARQT